MSWVKAQHQKQQRDGAERLGKRSARTIAVTLVFIAAVLAGTAHAATVRNNDNVSYRVIVCDEGCRRSHDNTDQRDFWLAPGESRAFPCYDRCFVGIFRNGAPPPLADMAAGGNDGFFRGDETAEIVDGQVRRRR